MSSIVKTRPFSPQTYKILKEPIMNIYMKKENFTRGEDIFWGQLKQIYLPYSEDCSHLILPGKLSLGDVQMNR